MRKILPVVVACVAALILSFCEPAWSAYQGQANLSGMVSPVDPGSWFNQGTASVTNPTANGRAYLKITGPLEVANHWRGRQRAIPATPYAIECMTPYVNNYQNAGNFAGCYLTDGTQLYLNVLNNGGTGSLTTGAVYAYYWSTNAGAGAVQIGTISPVPAIGTNVWLRIDDDGTNVLFKYSADGLLWKQYASTTRAAHALTPTNVGVGIDANDNSTANSATFFHLNIGTGI